MTIEEFMRDIAPKMRPGWVAMDGSGQWYFFKTEPSRATFLKGKEMKFEQALSEVLAEDWDIVDE